MGAFGGLEITTLCARIQHSDLLATLEALVERKSKFDYIIIETSGMADPGTSLRFPKRTGIGACIWEIYLYNQKHPYTGPVASCLWVDEELESQLYLDGIVTVVDAKHISRHIGKAHGSSTGGAFGWVDGWMASCPLSGTCGG